MNLQENIQRIKEMMGLLTEETQEKEIILIDGTSSAGKSQTAKILKAVPFYESTDPNQWVQIDSDHFSGDEGEERRFKWDPPSIQGWAKGFEYEWYDEVEKTLKEYYKDRIKTRYEKLISEI